MNCLLFSLPHLPLALSLLIGKIMSSLSLSLVRWVGSVKLICLPLRMFGLVGLDMVSQPHLSPQGGIVPRAAWVGTYCMDRHVWVANLNAIPFRAEGGLSRFVFRFLLA